MNFPQKISLAKTGGIVLFLTVVFIIAFSSFVQFSSPVLYGADGYYHIRVAHFIKSFGLRYPFRWAQFSTFKEFFSDKDLFFHIIIIPFVYCHDIVAGAKGAVIFLNLLFLAAFLYVLKKYQNNLIIPIFLITLYLCPKFFIRSLALRPSFLVNICTVIGIYLLIRKNRPGLFLVAFIYTLSHISFPMLFVFSLVCETIRFMHKRDFYLANIICVLSGIVLGLIVHPNFPNNLISFYLNGLLVPWYIFIGRGDIKFGLELGPISTKQALLDNLLPFFILLSIFWHSLRVKLKISFSSLVFFACAVIYIGLSFVAHRFWNTSCVLVVLFAASYLKDWRDSQGFKKEFPQKERFKITLLVLLWVTILAFYSQTHYFKYLQGVIHHSIRVNSHHENTAKWMKANIPAGETIYHADWGDSAAFICLNPKNNYLVVLDPIYMYQWSPALYAIYHNLGTGRNQDAYDLLKNVFKTRYGYTKKTTPFYKTIKGDKGIKILFEDRYGAVFKLLS